VTVFRLSWEGNPKLVKAPTPLYVGAISRVVSDAPETGVQDVIQNLVDSILARANILIGGDQSIPEGEGKVRLKYTRANWAAAADSAVSPNATLPAYKYIVLYRPVSPDALPEQATVGSIVRYVSEPALRWAPHFTVANTGVFFQHVDLVDTARHTKSTKYPNNESIAIAMDGRVGDVFTDDTYNGLARLIRDVGDLLGLDVSTANFEQVIIPSKQTSDTYIDPGSNFDAGRLAALVDKIPRQESAAAVFEEYDARGTDRILEAVERFADVEAEGGQTFVYLLDRARRMALGYVSALQATRLDERALRDYAASGEERLANAIKRSWNELALFKSQGDGDIQGVSELEGLDEALPEEFV